MVKSKTHINVLPNVVRDMSRAHFATLFDDTRSVCLSCNKQMCSKLDTIKKHYVRKHADVLRQVHGIEINVKNHLNPTNFSNIESYSFSNNNYERRDTLPTPPVKRAKICTLVNQVTQIAESSTAAYDTMSTSRSVTPTMVVSATPSVKFEAPTYVDALQQQIEAVIKEKNYTVNEHVLAVFASSNTPLELVENRHFIALCSSIPNYIAPTVTALTESISNLAASGPELIRNEVFAQNKPFSVVCGLMETVSGYNMSINVHYYDTDSGHVFNKLLDVISFQEKPPTSSIFHTISCNLSAHGADTNNFVKLVFDGGANLGTFFIPSNGTDFGDITQSAIQTTTTYIPPTLISEYENFLTQKVDGVIQHPQFYTCARNRLQAALKNVLDQNRQSVNLKKAVFTFLITVAKNPVIQTEIDNRTGKRLLFPCRTNWIVFYQAFSRVLELKDAVVATCKNHGIEFLQPEEWDLLKGIVKIILPINEFIVALEGTSSGGVSLLLGGLNGLLQLYEHMQAQIKSKVIKTLLNNLGDAIRTLFEDVFTSLVANSDIGDPMYAAACLLNPLVCADFPSNDDNLKVNAIVRAFEIYCKPASFTVEPDLAISRKSIYGFSSPFINAANNDVIRSNPIVAEAKAFIRTRTSDFGDVDSWKSWAGIYPRISKLAQLLFVIPATSSSANTVLSYYTFLGKGAGSNTDLATKRVLVSYNSFQ